MAQRVHGREVMSHTQHIDEFTIIHDGDYTGNVQIQRKTWQRPVWVPFWVLKRLVAEAVRDKRIAELEQASADELLGLK
jgi:hypothetical protein